MVFEMSKLNDLDREVSSLPTNYHGLIKQLGYLDSRIPALIKQHEDQGFDDTELWNLDYTIASFVYPRLKAFKENDCGYPGCFESPEIWKRILDKMLSAFGQIIDDNYSWLDKKAANSQKIGLDLFRLYYKDLWS